jgi:hypothetical protein
VTPAAGRRLQAARRASRKWVPQQPATKEGVDDFIRRADDTADLDVEAQERHELGPGVLLTTARSPGYRAPQVSTNSENCSRAGPRSRRAIASGRPVSPSHTTMRTSLVPRFFNSANKMPTAVKKRYVELIWSGFTGAVAAPVVGVSTSCGSLWFLDAGDMIITGPRPTQCAVTGPAAPVLSTRGADRRGQVGRFRQRPDPAQPGSCCHRHLRPSAGVAPTTAAD